MRPGASAKGSVRSRTDPRDDVIQQWQRTAATRVRVPRFDRQPFAVRGLTLFQRVEVVVEQEIADVVHADFVQRGYGDALLIG